jgi:cysteine desulfurase
MIVHNPVYLDNHATTPVDPRVLEAMLPFFGAKFGNAASRSHSFGWEAGKSVERARRRIADLAGADPREIVFTSGATESNNLALKGVVEANGGGGHIVTMSTEHRAVLDPTRHLERLGCRLTVLAPRADGRIDLDQLRAAVANDTVLVSVMYANNEIGVIQPVREIGGICRQAGVLFHCDAVQAFGKVPVHVEADQIDLMSISAHKMYGPKGIGALYVRRSRLAAGVRLAGVRLAAQIEGGGHELGMRSGTLNVPAIVGFGEACAICGDEMDAESLRTRGLRDRLQARIETGLDDVRVNGSLEHRLPGNLNMSFGGVDSEALLLSLPGLALSTGSACSAASVTPSHVLKALGVNPHSALRFGVGRFNAEEEMDFAGDRIVEAVRKLRELQPR